MSVIYLSISSSSNLDEQEFVENLLLNEEWDKEPCIVDIFEESIKSHKTDSFDTICFVYALENNILLVFPFVDVIPDLECIQSYPFLKLADAYEVWDLRCLFAGPYFILPDTGPWYYNETISEKKSFSDLFIGHDSVEAIPGSGYIWDTSSANLLEWMNVRWGSVSINGKVKMFGSFSGNSESVTVEDAVSVCTNKNSAVDIIKQIRVIVDRELSELHDSYELYEAKHLATHMLHPILCTDRSVSSPLLEYVRFKWDRCNLKSLSKAISVSSLNTNYFERLITSDLDAESLMIKIDKEGYLQYKLQIVSEYVSMASHIDDKDQKKLILVRLLYHGLCSWSVITGLRKKLLWYFNGSIWMESDVDSFLWNYVIHTFLPELKRIDPKSDLASLIQNGISRNQILKDVQKELYIGEFEGRLNSRIDVICHRNGVYDFTENCLRDAYASDYCSLNTGIDYTIYDIASKKMSKLTEILSQIFPNRNVYRFFLMSCSTFLEGYNSTKSIYIWWGSGNNAKSIIQKLVFSAFGQYCTTCPVSLLTGGRSKSGNATPELTQIEGKLVVFIQEPNSNEKIRAGQMKELTGNDLMYVRPLYGSPRNISIKAKFVLVCNNTMEIIGLDAASRRRIHVIPFETSFLTQAEIAREHNKGNNILRYRVMDYKIESQLQDLADVFFYLLVQEFKRFRLRSCGYHSNGLEIPREIESATEEFMDANNYCLKFIRDSVVRNAGSDVNPDHVYSVFKEWFRRAFPSRNIPNFEVFHSQLKSEGYNEDSDGLLRGVYVNFVSDSHFM